MLSKPAPTIIKNQRHGRPAKNSKPSATIVTTTNEPKSGSSIISPSPAPTGTPAKATFLNCFKISARRVKKLAK